MGELFKVEQKGNVTIFTNFSDMNLLVKQIPIPPKRKYHLLSVVKPGDFIMIDGPVYIDRLCFSLKKIPNMDTLCT